MKISCSIIRDLLPLYAEDLASQDTKDLVEEHICSCEDCQSILNSMIKAAPIPVEASPESLNKVKKTIRRRRAVSVMAAVMTMSLAACGEKAPEGYTAENPLIIKLADNQADGTPKQFAFCPIRQYGKWEESGSFGELLDHFYTVRDRKDAMRQKSGAVRKTVQNLTQRLKRKLAIQEKELTATFDRERLRQLGDIVTANIHKIVKGQTTVSCEDFYDENMAVIDIPISPILSPQQNAAKFYKDYTRMKNAEKELTRQLALAREELTYLKSVLEELERAGTEQELEAYRRAEATERMAQERSMRLRHQLNDLLDQVSARYEQTGQEIEVLTEDIRTNMIVNVSGSAIEDYVQTAEKINELDAIPAIELNISCPNVKQGGMAFGTTCAGAESVTKAIRDDKPINMKLISTLRTLSI